MVVTPTAPEPRRGKAPPIAFFSGDDPALLLDDWIPSLERAAQWNGWTSQEKLIQLPGYLMGRALQEWHLLTSDEQKSYSAALDALRSRLDPGNKTMAAQEFRHSLQRPKESVTEFIRRIEKAYLIAYGKDALNNDTRDTLLYGQLYEGLRHELMCGPSVSGSQGYKELCVAAKAEERRLAALNQRQQLKSTDGMITYRQSGLHQSRGAFRDISTENIQAKTSSSQPSTLRKCYNCGKPGHLATTCRQPKRESQGRTGTAKQVQSKLTSAQVPQESHPVTLQDLLYSSSEEESDPKTYSVRIQDSGSAVKCAKVLIQGVPAYGLVDTGADITIIGGSLFQKVATVARLRRRDFKKADKTPHTYNQQTFRLDGRMDLDVTFGERTLNTPVYIKVDAADQLLLSEGTCRQLGIVSYHPAVETWRGGGRASQLSKQHSWSRLPATGRTTEEPLEGRQKTTSSTSDSSDSQARVPLIRVNLVQTTHLLPHQSRVVEVRVDVDGQEVTEAPLLLESMQFDCGVDMEEALIETSTDGMAFVIISNRTGISQTVEENSSFGRATPVSVIEPMSIQVVNETAPCSQGTHLTSQNMLSNSALGDATKQEGPTMEDLRPDNSEMDIATVAKIHVEPYALRIKNLKATIGPTELLNSQQRQDLFSMLCQHHAAFALDDMERGETNMIEMTIDTGSAEPRRCTPRRMPFVVRQEVANQLKHMQEAGVVQPSSSPWASPVVMVKKKDGTHRFCVDYRQLNEVTKADTYPLPRIDDLLDQLGQCRYFSTLDLASGYWQIRMENTSREKTAFVTPQGLYEFFVMPFGLTNAPAVFQRLMQKVLAGLNPDCGPDFVAVYIDDVLVFSRTLEEHMTHVQRVLERIKQAGLKLKPSKCFFARREVEYLGHLVTPEGLKTNPKLIEAIKQFPRPTDVSGVRRFLGLASYYRRFIEGFSKIAEPLRELTRKNAVFQWTSASACEQAMTHLKDQLTNAPVLAYPSFDKPYTVETDASISGLGAVLSQVQDDKKLHPVAYASRSLTAAERNYSITELEALAVVWALTRFHSYLYGQTVTVITDHASVKAVLETPNPSGKYSRWWTKVYGAGMKDVHIVYRSGKLNHVADALSRSPCGASSTTELDGRNDQVAIIKTQPAEEIIASTNFWACIQRQEKQVTM